MPKSPKPIFHHLFLPYWCYPNSVIFSFLILSHLVLPHIQRNIFISAFHTTLLILLMSDKNFPTTWTIISYHIKHLRLCLRKKEWASGRNREKWEGRALGGLTFLHNIKPSSFGGTKKLYWRRVLESLYKFFKFNLYCYIIFKIKNIVIICINLSFSKKLVF